MTAIQLAWVLCAIAAAAAQTARNTLQSSLTASLGPVGATHVRFLYGLPFGLLFLAAATTFSGAMPVPHGAFAGWVMMGALSQIAATALMLAAMREKAFVVVTVYTKTELVQAALLGAFMLGDALHGHAILAVGLASAGVVLASWPKRGQGLSAYLAWRPALMGLAAGGLFAVAAVGYRGATLAFEPAQLVSRAAFTLAIALGLQTALLSLWLFWRDPGKLNAIIRAWRPSLGAGLAGATASFLWFAAFTMTTAANVKMVGLIEIPFAWVISRRIFGEGLTPREIGGLGLIILGVFLILLF